jgi:site-specific recombinase XerD
MNIKKKVKLKIMGDLSIREEAFQLMLKDSAPVLLQSKYDVHGLYGPYLSEFISREIKANTRKLYKNSLESLLVFCVRAGYNVQELTEGNLLMWKKWLLEKSKLGRTTINTYMICVKSYYRSYNKMRSCYDVSGVLNILEVEDEFKGEPVNLTEMRMILEACGKVKADGSYPLDVFRNRVMIQIVCTTGVRQMVLENMTWGDIVVRQVRMENRDLEFRHYLQYSKKGKGDRHGTVALSSVCMQGLMEWKKAAENLFGCAAESTWPVFFGLSAGCPQDWEAGPRKMNNSSIRGIITKAMKDAGVYDKGSKTPHKIRHGFACTVLAETGDKELVRKMLGHAYIKTTDLYTKMEDKNRMFRVVNDIMDLREKA